MAYLGSGVEYALHCLLWLAQPLGELPSSRDLADMQGVPAPFMAKIFPKLEKAGIVLGSVGIRGGYRLARPAEEITVLDVVEAVEGRKPLFGCQEVRGRCALFEGNQPAWSASGVCGIHAVMLRAERSMREELARTTIAALAESTAKKAPPDFASQAERWFVDRTTAREQARTEAMNSGIAAKRQSKRTAPQARTDGHAPDVRDSDTRPVIARRRTR